MLAFIFHTSKPSSYIAPFEAILTHIAKAHNLAYAKEFIDTNLPYQYAFILKSPAAKDYAPTKQKPQKSLDSTKERTEDFSERVLEFADDLSRALPLSMYFIFDRIEPEYEASHQSPRFYRAARTCAKPLALVSDTLALIQSFEARDSSFTHLCKQFFSHIYAQNSSQSLKPITPSTLFACLDSLARTLSTQPIIITTTRGCYELSTKPLESSALMFWEMGALQSFMRIDSAQLSCLASVEKPSMKLCPKDIFRDELLVSGVEIECLLAFEPMLMLLGSCARACGVEYVFIRKSKKPPHLTYTSLFAVPKLERIIYGRDGIYLHDRRSKHDLFSIIAKHYPRQDQEEAKALESNAKKPKTQREQNASLMLVCYLSLAHNSAIWIYDGASYKQALPVCFASSEASMLETLAREYKGADRLLANYQAHFGALSALESSLDSTPRISKNLTDMFAIIARVLGFCESRASDDCAKESLLNYAKLCLRDKGPRIDYKLKKTPQGGLELDYPRILRSCMSFALAGVEREMIAFGVLDSLAEFLGNFVRDMAQNYALGQVFVCGDMLSHKIFFDKILLYLPRDITLILPQDGYIDTL